MSNVSTTALQVLLSYFGQTILMQQTRDHLNLMDPSKKRDLMLASMDDDSRLHKIQDTLRFSKIFDNAIEETRRNVLLFESAIGVKKYHFYLIKKISEFETEHSDFIKGFLVKLDSSNAKGMEEKLKLDWDRWNLFKTRIGKEINWEIDETIKFEKSANIETLKTQKLQWKGTPGEFGAIFDLFFDNGYLAVIKDKKNMVRHLNSLFEIRNDNNEIVDSDYLYKCFKDKKKSYPPAHLKLPYSDNYNKDK